MTERTNAPLSEGEACRMMREALGFPLTPAGEECIAGCMGVIFRRLRSETGPQYRRVHCVKEGDTLVRFGLLSEAETYCEMGFDRGRELVTLYEKKESAPSPNGSEHV